MVEDPDCIFCEIVAGEIPATKVYEDDQVVAFNDTNPRAPVHVLVITRKHLTNVAEVGADPEAAAGLLAGIRATTETLGVQEFRTVFNTGAGVGQSVFHVHGHVLAGRSFGWPPG